MGGGNDGGGLLTMFLLVEAVLLLGRGGRHGGCGSAGGDANEAGETGGRCIYSPGEAHTSTQSAYSQMLWRRKHMVHAAMPHSSERHTPGLLLFSLTLCQHMSLCLPSTDLFPAITPVPRRRPYLRGVGWACLVLSL